MKRIWFTVLLLVIILGVVLGCNTTERLSEDIYFSGVYTTEVHDDSIEYGEAIIVAGDTAVVVNHTLGAIPSNIQLTLANKPSDTISVSVKNPQLTQFGIEITAILADDLHIYWVAKK